MAHVPDWFAMEQSIAELLMPDRSAQDRAALLTRLSQYAGAVVQHARREGAILPTPDAYERASGWLQRPVFVCGHHRCGTTLLQELLDGHPELLVLPDEGTYFTSFSYVARANRSERDMDQFAADWVSRLVDPNSEPHFKLGRSTRFGNSSVDFVRRLLGWQSVLDARSFFPVFSPLLSLACAFREVAAPSTAPRLWVEKTPLNELHVDRLAGLPGAKFVHLVREPGATLNSLLERYRRSDVLRFDAARHAHAIARSLALARRNEVRYPGRYLLVRYEDLAIDPGLEMERVRTFLGISPHGSLTVPTVGGVAVRSNSSFGTGTPGIVHGPRMETLSPHDRKLVAALAGGAARQLGYGSKPLPLYARCAVRVRHMPAAAVRGLRARLGRVLRLRHL